MMSVAEKGHTEIVKLLSSHMKNPNADFGGHTPIHVAALHGKVEVIKILAPLTDNPNPRDEDGKTPIELAISCGHSEVVKLLKTFQESAKRPLTSNAKVFEKSIKRRRNP